jgi:hypothetical protein
MLLVKDMAFGFPARFTESRTFHLQMDELSAIVKSALENLGWAPRAVGSNELIASVHNSPFTFGEAFNAKILPSGVIRVESKCVRGGRYRMPQIFDFGANRKNVEAFFAQVELERHNPQNQRKP